MKRAVAHFYWSHLGGGKKVLDLGCGTGELGRYKRDGTEVWGVDFNRALVEDASRYEMAQVWDLDLPTPLPFPESYFDAVVAKDILEHLQKPWRTLAEIRRVIKPGGIILASVICHRSHSTWSDYTHVRGFTIRSLRQMFTDAGFRVVDVWRMGGVPLTSRFNLIWLVPQLLRFPPFDWVWTRSYEIKAQRLA
jgi:ubiquinone/menaquinone biosynthesis C-methylase UbiE